MGMWHKPLADVLAKADHLVALGEIDVYLDDDDPDLPWAEVSRIEKSRGYRLNGPTGFYAIADKAGLRLKWSIDFEGRDANGQPVSLFDRDRIREVMRKLPRRARLELASFLETEVLPGIEKTTAEWRGYLNKQIDSEDCVRGLITYARQEKP